MFLNKINQEFADYNLRSNVSGKIDIDVKEHVDRKAMRFMGEEVGKMISGALELSNVNMTSELAGLLQAQQAFSGSSRIMQTETDMTRRLIGG